MILHGFIKKTPDTPPKELKIARKRMIEVKNERYGYAQTREEAPCGNGG